MITFLQGQIVERQPTRIALDVHGVGYEVFIPLSSYDRLPKIGEVCRILTYDNVREDAHFLFGFMTEAERSMFLLLLSVSGVGPKTALAALSGLSVRELKVAITQRDVKRLSSISGVGKKIAERIALELKDKIGQAEALEAVAGESAMSPEELKTRDAMLALIALGYKQDAAKEIVASALQGASADMSVEELVRKALSSK